jgi:SAM-dependent methyltransferase
MIDEFFKLNLYEKETELCQIMNSSGSDKGSGHHNYTKFYDFIFKNIKNDVKYVFELGLGTNNLQIPSNMSGLGTPCGSLRGWENYFTNAKIFGADIDKEILFQEENINTFYCDQTNPSSVKELCNNFNFKFDVVIEDGLHTFDANKVFLENFIEVVKDGGIFIIEDIDIRYFDQFKEYISLNKNKYHFMELVEIPNEKNKSDNNIILIIK